MRIHSPRMVTTGYGVKRVPVDRQGASEPSEQPPAMVRPPGQTGQGQDERVGIGAYFMRSPEDARKVEIRSMLAGGPSDRRCVTSMQAPHSFARSPLWLQRTEFLLVLPCDMESLAFAACRFCNHLTTSKSWSAVLPFCLCSCFRCLQVLQPPHNIEILVGCGSVLPLRLFLPRGVTRCHAVPLEYDVST